jgi:hypothetical protein
MPVAGAQDSAFAILSLGGGVAHGRGRTGGAFAECGRACGASRAVSADGLVAEGDRFVSAVLVAPISPFNVTPYSSIRTTVDSRSRRVCYVDFAADATIY